MTAIFPALPGLGWSVTKSAKFATRVQRAVNGRELRALDQPNPVWSWTLTYPLLRDKWDIRGAGIGSGGTGYDELRTLAGFFLQQQGAFQPFLFDDPDRPSRVTKVARHRRQQRHRPPLVRTMGVACRADAAPNPSRRSTSMASFNHPNLPTTTGRLVTLRRRRRLRQRSPPISPTTCVRFSDDTAELRISCCSSEARRIKLQSRVTETTARRQKLKRSGRRGGSAFASRIGRPPPRTSAHPSRPLR